MSELTVEQALQQAIIHHKNGQLQDAERLYRAILNVHSTDPDANHNLGVMAVQVGCPAEGIPYLKVALDANPKQTQYWLSYVDTLILVGQTELARATVEQARLCQLQEEAVAALVQRLGEHAIVQEIARAVECREAGQYEEAMAILKSRLLTRPQEAESYAHLAYLFSLTKQDDQAWIVLNKALLINPSMPIVQRNLARLLLKQKKIDEAQQAAQSAWQSYPDDPENQLVLAAALGAKGQCTEALSLVESALRIRPSYAEAFATRASLRLRMKNLVENKRTPTLF